MCLGIGIDPPWLIRPRQYPQREAWIDTRRQQQEPCKQITQEVEQQYKEHAQAGASYSSLPDPTVTATLTELKRARYEAQGDRVLVHYNGHGVPAPTRNEGLWMFSDDYGDYVAVQFRSIVEAATAPIIGVFDCNTAGVAVAEYLAELEDAFGSPTAGSNSSSTAAIRKAGEGGGNGERRRGSDGEEEKEEEEEEEEEEGKEEEEEEEEEEGYVLELDDALLLGACRADEVLPMDPKYPADIFTACLTTPVRMAALWFCHHSRLHSYPPELAENIPGSERKLGTPLGDLQWTFTMVTEAIAFDVLPRDTFCRLFRRDSLVASLFSGFLLAERIMRPLGCHPVSRPVIPAAYKHRLWDAWDLALDAVLAQVHEMSTNGNSAYKYTVKQNIITR